VSCKTQTRSKTKRKKDQKTSALLSFSLARVNRKKVASILFCFFIFLIFQRKQKTEGKVADFYAGGNGV